MTLFIMTSQLVMAVGKAPSTISFDVNETFYEIGSANPFVAPKFNNPDDLFVMFSTTDPSVAVVDELSGDIMIMGAGVAVITAVSEETDQFMAGEASYTITVTDPSLVFGASFSKDFCGFTEEGDAAGKGIFKNWWGWMRVNGSNKVETLTDCYLVSPEIVLDKGTNTVSFTHKTMNFPGMQDKAKLMIRETGGQWAEIEGLVYPAAGQFEAQFTGDVAVPAEYNGKTVQFAFKYITDGSAYIWDFQNFAIRKNVVRKPESTISFDVTEVKYELGCGEAFVAPKLNNPDNLSVTYESDDTNVATVDKLTGEVTIITKGVVNITATSEETDNFQAGRASYTIVVVANNEPAYGLKIAGKEINSGNAADILGFLGMGEGKMWYDAYTRTLTLDNVTLDTDRKNAIESLSSMSDFTIRLIGDNVIVQRGAARSMLSAARNTITGDGTLEISSPLTQGIFVNCVDLEISGGCTVIANGSWGICSDGNAGVFTINASKVIAQGDFGSICDFKEIRLVDCSIVSPEGTTVRDGKVVYEAGGTCSEKVVIDKVNDNYDLTIAGIKVNNANAADVLGNKTVVYEPETQTLYLDNAVINGNSGYAIAAKSDINIVLDGNSKITSEADAVLFGGSVMMRGEGSVTINAGAAAVTVSGKELCISEIGELVAKGNKGIVGIADAEGYSPKLRVIKSAVKAQGTEMSLGGFGKVIMDGCHIFAPDGCVIDNGTAFVDGKVCTEEVVIDRTIEYPLYVSGEAVTSLNHEDVLGDGKVKFDIENKVLSITDFNFVTNDAASGIAVQSAMGQCTIEVNGDNVISTPYIGLICSSDVEFTGNGTLDVTGTSGGLIFGDAVVTINEGVKMSIKGDTGISSLTEDGSYMGILVLNSADLIVEGSASGSVGNLEDIELNGCELKEPVNAVVYNGDVLLDGEICKERVVFGKIDTGISENGNSDIMFGVSEGILMINNVTEIVGVAVYDMTGRLVYSAEVSGDTAVNLAPGSYVVVVGGKCAKVIIG